MHSTLCSTEEATTEVTTMEVTEVTTMETTMEVTTIEETIAIVVVVVLVVVIALVAILMIVLLRRSKAVISISIGIIICFNVIMFFYDWIFCCDQKTNLEKKNPKEKMKLIQRCLFMTS